MVNDIIASEGLGDILKDSFPFSQLNDFAKSEFKKFFNAVGKVVVTVGTGTKFCGRAPLLRLASKLSEVELKRETEPTEEGKLSLSFPSYLLDSSGTSDPFADTPASCVNLTNVSAEWVGLKELKFTYISKVDAAGAVGIHIKFAFDIKFSAALLGDPYFTRNCVPERGLCKNDHVRVNAIAIVTGKVKVSYGGNASLEGIAIDGGTELEFDATASHDVGPFVLGPPN